MKASTGLRNYMLDTGSFKAGMALAVLKIYSGAEPATADAAATGTRLAAFTVSGAGSGLNWAAAAAAGVLAKAAETWQDSSCDASGTAGYFRLAVLSVEAVGVDGGVTTTERRIQGTVGTAGADLNLESTTFTAAASRTIDFFSIALPTL